MSETIHEQLQLSLYMTEKASYDSLDIVDTVYPHWVISYVMDGDVVTSSCGESWRARAGMSCYIPLSSRFLNRLLVLGRINGS
ncbi:hypothetical protein [Dictyobacter kobayashii]|uniref:Uncharacterized protein n=1 Tax=Dictyobacter kobayashii TaxID=2014872 RepID=A0A402AKN2_9CHLR|nr:hypothetical protein [Dictyobacter kobayashii]GCE19570.1 hypothetical protein KDK_33700 [Dictyobacter kobayashii]